MPVVRARMIRHKDLTLLAQATGYNKSLASNQKAAYSWKKP